MSHRIRGLRELGEELARATALAPAPPAPRFLRAPRLAGVAVAILMLAGAAVALAATGAFSTGAPVKPGRSTPHSGGGAVVAHSVQGIAAEADDPAGGPRWGIRMLHTTRGLGCLQIGRVVGGRLGVLGQDGAFGDDGRFHPLPAAVGVIQNPVDCGTLDAHGQLYLAFASEGVIASAYELGCNPPSDVEPHPRPALCPPADERAVYGGVLGPEAVSVTYLTPAGSAVTIPVGRDGSYLIVQPDPEGDLGGANFGGLLPSPGNGQPITQITYRGGLVCRISATTEMTSTGGPCAPPGYATPPIHSPSAQLVAAPLHVVRRIDTVLDGHRADVLEISFVSHVAITSVHSGYVLMLHLPQGGSCRGTIAGTQTDQDYTAGQTVHLVYAGAAYSGSFIRCRGHFTGTIDYTYDTNSNGEGLVWPGLPGHGVTAVRVGTFSFSNP